MISFFFFCNYVALNWLFFDDIGIELERRWTTSAVLDVPIYDGLAFCCFLKAILAPAIRSPFFLLIHLYLSFAILLGNSNWLMLLLLIKICLFFSKRTLHRFHYLILLLLFFNLVYWYFHFLPQVLGKKLPKFWPTDTQLRLKD